jgi:hypothetical protein
MSSWSGPRRPVIPVVPPTCSTRNSQPALIDFRIEPSRSPAKICPVQSVGPGEDGTIWVNLTDIRGQFTEVWFTVLPAIRQQALETALAALQSSLDCQVGLTGTDPGSQIYRIHAQSA